MEPDRWLGVELRHLAALEAVAEERSFGRAAELLGYTQSAISQQIATLERIVGVQLIDRPGGPKAVSLTEAGELLLRHANAIVARLQAAEADLARYAEGRGGTLRIGTFQSVGARVLPSLMRAFGDSWPDVRIALTESSSDEDLADEVERGELDLAFVMLPPPEGPFDLVELMDDPYVLVVPADSPLGERRQPLKSRDLEGLPLISNRLCRSTVLAENQLRARGVSCDVVFRSDDNGTVQGMVAAGVGVALVPLLTVDEGDSRVRILDLGRRFPPRRIAIASHRDRQQAPAARAFVETARELCAGLQQRLAAAAVA